MMLTLPTTIATASSAILTGLLNPVAALSNLVFGTASAEPTEVTGPPQEPQLRPGLDQSEVTPGIEGFLMTFFMAALVIIVARLMVRSVRRVKMRSPEAEQMLIERNQPRLKNKEAELEAPEIDDLDPDRLTMLRRKYPGYLDAPPLEPQAPETGRGKEDTTGDQH